MEVKVDRKIYVTFQKEGIHKYPAALTDPKLADVQFLGWPHRHIFHFKVWVSVSHDNREREFIQEKRFMESLYSDGVLELDYKSVEMMADDLYEKLAERYAGENRTVWIDISEDGENGCFITYETKI